MIDAPIKTYGTFELLEKVDADGISEIFKARALGAEGFQKIVAIKRIVPVLSANPKFTTPLLQEIEDVITLNHSNIVHTFDVGKERGCYYLSLEWVHGISLEKLLQKNLQLGITLDLPISLFIIREIAKALEYAHRKKMSSQALFRSANLFHGALCPSSVLIGQNGHIKVTGFGFSQALFRYNTHPEKSLLKKKFAYLSPEFALGSPPNFNADIFSLGTLAFELLTGTNPFQTSTPVETLNRVRIGKTEALKRLNSELADDISDFIQTMLAYEPDERPTAAQIFETISSFLNTLQSSEPAERKLSQLIK